MVNRFQVGRLYAWCWKSFVVLSRVKLDMRDASPRSKEPLPSGPFVCPFLTSFDVLSRIRLDISAPFVCPVLEEFCCVRAGSSSTCEFHILAVHSRFQVGRLCSLFCWKSENQLEYDNTCVKRNVGAQRLACRRWVKR